MKTEFHEGDTVKLIRNVRNDGTFPGKEVGDLLITRGSVGYVQSIGTYLQDQVIYEVHFMEGNLMIGCREEELVSADSDWIPSKFEFREKVLSTKTLVKDGDTIVEIGKQGEIVQVIDEGNYVYHYHVRFPGITLQVPESALEADPEAVLHKEASA
jgi:nitrogen fixation protein NifZ